MAIYLGYIIDLIIGDPANWPHPIIIIGRLINFLEQMIKQSLKNKFGGLLLLIIAVGIVFITTKGVLLLADWVHPNIRLIVEVIMIYQILATKCLAKEAMKIYDALKNSDFSKARILISYLVSRDTEQMSEEDIIKATIETVSENIVDAIVSPLFFICLGGPAFGFVYKTVNTLDSMVGYKNEEYKDFGFFSAKCDDVLNFIPARITGFLIVLSAFILQYDYIQAFNIFIRDRKNHSSPNSAHSEAPVAGALKVQLGGEATYFGVTYQKPTMGDALKIIDYNDIKKSVKLMYVTSFLALLIFSIIL